MLRSFPACLASVSALLAWQAQGDELADAGRALLAALSESQRGDATWPFGDEEREDVHFAPFPLDGVEHGALSEEASSRVEEVLAVSLSRRGHQTVRAIRDLELAVREKERGRFWSFLSGRFRDPGRYFVALFGQPSSAAPWAFRYEGHRVVAFAGTREEALELLTNDAVQPGLFRPASFVGRCAARRVEARV